MNNDMMERKAMAMRDAGYDVYATLETKLAKAMEALRKIAKLSLTRDLHSADYYQADFESEYDAIIAEVRTVVSKLESTI